MAVTSIPQVYWGAKKEKNCNLHLILGLDNVLLRKVKKSWYLALSACKTKPYTSKDLNITHTDTDQSESSRKDSYAGQPATFQAWINQYRQQQQGLSNTQLYNMRSLQTDYTLTHWTFCGERTLWRSRLTILPISVRNPGSTATFTEQRQEGAEW